MNKYIIIIIVLFNICIPMIGGQIILAISPVTLNENRDSQSVKKNLYPESLNAASKNKINNSKITIYYGLNESHSRSWVQVAKNGLVGISYFQRFENNDAEGILCYQTIYPNGSTKIDSVTRGTRLEKSVLLFDMLSKPHIFVASSDNVDQIIDHYYRNDNDQWQSETIVHFFNQGGRFIYELSADSGPDYSFHLLILKTRSDVDSDDFMNAWINSNLYHLTNATGNWKKELIHNYDMAYTYDMYIKSSSRQDIQVDDEGYVHVTFSEQIDAEDDPSRLLYATNKTGTWEIETALNYDEGSRDDAGWFPSLCLDNNGIPYISCMYVNRVYTYSATSCKLYLLKRLGDNYWRSEIIAQHDDGYYGSDGRNYTGALSHLVFDETNTPNIIFSDIASTHWPNSQKLNVGNIRYGIYKNGIWDFTTIYRQPLPIGFFNAVEMHGMCLLIPEGRDTIRVIGQELVIIEENTYSSNLLNFEWKDINDISDDTYIKKFELYQNYPNPFNSTTKIQYDLPQSVRVNISIYDVVGRRVKVLENNYQWSGSHTVQWDGKDEHDVTVTSGIYFCCIHAGEFNQSIKLIFIR